MESRGGDWRAVLLAVAGLGGTLFALAIAGSILAYAALGAANPAALTTAPPLLDGILLASALILIGAAFFPSAYYSIRRLRGREVPATEPKPLKVWQGLILFLVWAAASALAQFLFNHGPLKWLTPPLYLIAIGTPVYLLLRLVAGGLKPGSRLRTWGVFSTSMALAAPISGAAEILLVVIGAVVVGIYIGLHPDQFRALQGLVEKLSSAAGPDQILDLIGPWLNNPLTILLALVFFSGLTPLIEESAKSIAIWTVFDRLESPAQGFVIGAISGAGFGLIESLLVSASADADWAATLLVRGGSTMMHIATASLTGWGIASFRVRKRPGVLIGMYALAMFIHSLWNACVILIVAGGVRNLMQTGAPDLIGSLLIALGGGTLLLLCLAIPFVLGGINWKLRVPSLPSPALSKENAGEGGQAPDGG
jgi:RsiW-degrading membrane proteinase PrsW (M82 family)